MVAIAVLAAGKGTRMKSDLPKVLHPLGGRSLVERVLQSASVLNPSRQLVIVGYRGETVREALAGLDVEFVEQAEQLGTGHAVQQVIPFLEGFQDDLLVLNGDVPLLRPETMELFLKTHREKGNPATILTAIVPEPKGYGRVFCDENMILQEIIEDRDCTPEQRQNARVNAGIYCFRWQDLAQVLPKLTTNNDQKEYYITDAVNYLTPATVMDVPDYQEILGINDRKQLADAYGILQTRIKDSWLMKGVTIIDPTSVTIDDTVTLEPNVVIEPQTHLRGTTSIKSGSRIGPGSLVENSQIGENVTVLFSAIFDSVIKAEATVGPYAHMRSHAEVGEGCRIGNFVELKNSQLGDRTNVAHLSYIGDATLGTRVNVGGGTITANYDGVKKHRTTIGDRSKTGVNNTLIAPLVIGEDVTIAGGSTITEDLPNDCLAIGRARQVVKPGWRLKAKLEESPETPQG
jgi:bifunctional UDP-N-acetylglucosamine pyrophosphorylase / glucosamine-1-phosphate N-acetyltransferase